MSEEKDEFEYEEYTEISHWEPPNDVRVSEEVMVALNPAGHVPLPEDLVVHIASSSKAGDRVNKNWLAVGLEVRPLFAGRSEFTSDKPRCGGGSCGSGCSCRCRTEGHPHWLGCEAEGLPAG